MYDDSTNEFWNIVTETTIIESQYMYLCPNSRKYYKAWSYRPYDPCLLTNTQLISNLTTSVSKIYRFTCWNSRQNAYVTIPLIHQRNFLFHYYNSVPSFWNIFCHCSTVYNAVIGWIVNIHNPQCFASIKFTTVYNIHVPFRCWSMHHLSKVQTVYVWSVFNNSKVRQG